MLSTHTCPYCSHRLLRHISGRKLYWRCSNCRAELPALSTSLEFQISAEASLTSTDAFSTSDSGLQLASLVS